VSFNETGMMAHQPCRSAAGILPSSVCAGADRVPARFNDALIDTLHAAFCRDMAMRNARAVSAPRFAEAGRAFAKRTRKQLDAPALAAPQYLPLRSLGGRLSSNKALRRILWFCAAAQ
jgi:hypothetical protein